MINPEVMFDGTGAIRWCTTHHTCHHWFEGECSAACDRGEHDHPIGSPDCADPREQR